MKRAWVNRLFPVRTDHFQAEISGTMSTQQTDANALQELKKNLRAQAHERRNAQENKDGLSEIICDQLMATPEYQAAKTVLWYVDVRSEVRTRNHFPKALGKGQKVIVPYCVDGLRDLFHLESMDELSLGMYRILEPKTELRDQPGKRVYPQDLDLVVVPGVAFDRRGGRMGHGFGYYDKLLEHVKPGTPLLALAFECQVYDEIPVASHDVFMNAVITEKGVIRPVKNA